MTTTSIVTLTVVRAYKSQKCANQMSNCLPLKLELLFILLEDLALIN